MLTIAASRIETDEQVRLIWSRLEYLFPDPLQRALFLKRYLKKTISRDLGDCIRLLENPESQTDYTAVSTALLSVVAAFLDSMAHLLPEEDVPQRGNSSRMNVPSPKT